MKLKSDLLKREQTYQRNLYVAPKPFYNEQQLRDIVGIGKIYQEIR